MFAKPGNIPLAGYAAVIALLFAFLSWQNGAMRARERDLERETQKVAAEGGTTELLRQGSTVDLKSQALIRYYALARQRFKIGFLLLVVFPTSVLFPAWLTAHRPTAKDPKVVSARSMTRDDIDLGIPAHRRTMTPHSRLLVVNLSLFAAATGVLCLFPLLKPRAYAEPRTWVLFGVAALMAFSGSGLAFRLKERFETPGRIALRLGAGFLVFAGLALFFL